MPQRAMQKRLSTPAENVLDSAGKFREPPGVTHLKP